MLSRLLGILVMPETSPQKNNLPIHYPFCAQRLAQTYAVFIQSVRRQMQDVQSYSEP
jgi:hypothetical protein